MRRADILDKPLESIFGYISVLPGAFSACAFPYFKNTLFELSSDATPRSQTATSRSR